MTISKAKAERLWDRLRVSLLSTQDAIIQIIELKAWEPLGYDTFREAWVEKMSDLDLATSPMIRVVYQMLNEDATDAEVAEVVKGVQIGTVATLRRQWSNNVPPEAASLYVRPATTGARTASRGTLFLHVGAEKLARWDKLAKGQGKSAADLAIEILNSEFEKMAVPVG
jgi:hypothetical protein